MRDGFSTTHHAICLFGLRNLVICKITEALDSKRVMYSLPHLGGGWSKTGWGPYLLCPPQKTAMGFNPSRNLSNF